MVAGDPSRIAFVLVCHALLLAGCAHSRSLVEPKEGLSRLEVRNLLGDPDEKTDFVVPRGSFFGPQEALAGKARPGDTVEEWRYDMKDRVMYVWFSAIPGSGERQKRVIASGTYPRGAVY